MKYLICILLLSIFHAPIKPDPTKLIRCQKMIDDVKTYCLYNDCRDVYIANRYMYKEDTDSIESIKYICHEEN